MNYKEGILVLWVTISSWYYGYHISELNFPEPSITCSDTTQSSSLLPDCLGISSNRYSIITAIFTIGGLIGALSTARVIGKFGMYGSIWLTGVINLAGSGLMALSSHWVMMVIGRFISGLCVGLAITSVPPLLSHVATTSPSTYLNSKRGLIGTLNQFGIVLGILAAQLVGLAATGMRGDRRGGWRWVVAVSGMVAVAQMALGLWLRPHVKSRETSGSQIRSLGTEQGDEESEEAPLLSPSAGKDKSAAPFTISQVLANPAIRPQVLLVAFILAAQQFSGINAVMFYSTPVMKPLIPDKAGLIGIGLAVLNAVMTVPPMILVDRIGRIPLLLTSLSGMIISSLLLSYALNAHHQILSTITLLTFGSSFATGLGPIPFLLVSELVPPEAIPATSSIALSASWIANFTVALGFLPLRNALSWQGKGGRMEGEGRVFWVFLAFQVITAAVVWVRLYKR